MFHEENWIINVTFSVKQTQNCHKTRQTTQTELITNLLIKFHEDVTINVASRVQNALPPGGHVFQQTRIILELNQDVIGTYVVTKFYTNQTINLAPWVLTWFYYSHIWKNAPPHASHVFQPTETIFKPVQDIIEKNRVTKFYEDQTINVASRVFTMKIARPPGGHVFQLTETIFELVQSIIETNLTKFHDDSTINVASRVKNFWPHGSHFPEDRTINVASRALTRKKARTPGGHVFQLTGTIFKLFLDTSRVFTRKNGQPPCDHVFQPTGTIFELFHDDWTINVISKVLTRTIFKLVQDIIGTNLLTNFHEDRTINVATIVLTRKNAPPLGGHIFQATTNLLTKFHEDWTINVASIVFPRKMLTPHTNKKPSQKLTMSTMCSGGEYTLAKDKYIQSLTGDKNIISSIIVLTKFHDRVLTRINFPPLASMKKDPPPGGHVFQATGTIFKLVQSIALHDDQTINVAFRVKNAWPPVDHFHEDWTIDVTYMEKCPPPWQPYIIGKNLLTNFH
ncbi:hypothetical protein DPMN_139634 [Dreissena polymorpha]|uniref:Uncharacterized protein n=1 Tax=Dreissena polymorpha TaxID=45954 RepID=A0A9D4G6M1_DREPO|nr:hypothetical protein DPMN_139634 [Dreissena polymorpha]